MMGDKNPDNTLGSIHSGDDGLWRRHQSYRENVVPIIPNYTGLTTSNGLIIYVPLHYNFNTNNTIEILVQMQRLEESRRLQLTNAFNPHQYVQQQLSGLEPHENDHEQVGSHQYVLSDQQNYEQNQFILGSHHYVQQQQLSDFEPYENDQQNNEQNQFVLGYVQQQLSGFEPLENDQQNHQPNNVPSTNEEYTVICLVGEKLTIPRRGSKLEEAGLRVNIRFHGDSDGQIKSVIEEKLHPHLKDKNWRFYKCKSSKPVLADVPIYTCRFEHIKRISGYRNKLYIGTESGPLLRALEDITDN